MKYTIWLFGLVMLVLQSCASGGYVYQNGKRKMVRQRDVQVIHSGHAPKDFLFGNKEVPCSAHW
jgi:hypothetical protein